MLPKSSAPASDDKAALERRSGSPPSGTFLPRALGKRRRMDPEEVGPSKRTYTDTFFASAAAFAPNDFRARVEAALNSANHIARPLAYPTVAARTKSSDNSEIDLCFASASQTSNPALSAHAARAPKESTLSLTSSLPHELILHILGFTDGRSFVRLGRVNRQFRALTSQLMTQSPWPDRIAAAVSALPEKKAKRRGGPLCLHPRHPLVKSTFPLVRHLDIYSHSNFKRLRKLLPNICSVHAFERPALHENWYSVVSTLRNHWPGIHHFIGQQVTPAALRAMQTQNVRITRLGCINASQERYNNTAVDRTEDMLHCIPSQLESWVSPRLRRRDGYDFFGVPSLEEIHIKLPAREQPSLSFLQPLRFDPLNAFRMCKELRTLLDKKQTVKVSEDYIPVLAQSVKGYVCYYNPFIPNVETVSDLKKFVVDSTQCLLQEDRTSLHGVLEAVLRRLTDSDEFGHLQSMKLTVMPKHTAFFSAFKPLNFLDDSRSLLISRPHAASTLLPSLTGVYTSDVLLQILHRAPDFQLTIAYADSHVSYTAATSQSGARVIAEQKSLPHAFEPEIFFVPRP